MSELTLAQIALLLAAAAIAAPLARVLKIGTVLGYLAAGIALGPFGAGRMFSLYEAEAILHIAEFGVVLLLFLIGLELRPTRLWAMRSAIVGVGGAQVLLSGLVLAAAAGFALGLAPGPAAFVGLALALSSTAFALQVLEEKGELTARHGRLAFAVLLFQDLAAIPLIALAPLFAIGAAASGAGMDLLAAVKAIAVIVAVIVVGRFALETVFRLIARTRVKEAMTAAALLTVVATAWVMDLAGLSASLGAFLAGALLADSSYRHQLEADLKPFEGLLLGLFFTAIGMSLRLDLVLAEPVYIIGLVAGLLAAKLAVLYLLGRSKGLDGWAARRLGLSISQGGEFAFVLMTAGVTAAVVERDTASLVSVVVTLSMVATPALLLIDDVWGRPKPAADRPFDDMPDEHGHVIVAGFGRFGQIAARILRARRIPFIALDLDPEQIAFVARFGSEAFYGDASRPDILDAARAGEARALVLAIDDVEASLRTAAMVRERYPGLPVLARARNRAHVHRLMDLGVTVIHRETFAASLALTRDLLKQLGLADRDVDFTISTFEAHDRRRLYDDYAHYTDLEKLQSRARSDADNLAKLFDEDAREQGAAIAAAEGGATSRSRRSEANL